MLALVIVQAEGFDRMSMLDVCLVLLNLAFWGGNLVYYFRAPIFRWLDNRIRHEPVTDRLRLWFSPARK